MGVQCCKQQNDQPQELANQVSHKEPHKQNTESQTITKELIECRQKESLDILYIKEPFQIQGDSQFIRKIAGDMDELDLIQHSLRSLDSCSDNLPDDTNTKKTILKRELHYISKGKVQLQNKKKVRFDLHKKY